MPTYLVSPDCQVSSVVQSRSLQLRSSGRRPLPAATTLCGGRLLAYFPQDNLACGTAEAESEGFFDVNNVPPFDTWVWLAQTVRTEEYADGTRGDVEMHYLVAWVPPDFIELATRGLAVNPEHCILWLDTLDNELVRSLRRMKLIQGEPSRPERQLHDGDLVGAVVHRGANGRA
jgi:hypothetical protein